MRSRILPDSIPAPHFRLRTPPRPLPALEDNRQRTTPMAEPASFTVVILGLAVAALTSLFAALMPEAKSTAIMAAAAPEVTTTVNITSSVMDDNRLRLVCVAGAIGGALLSWSLSKKEDHRVSVRKILASSIAGIIFTPTLMRWHGFDLTTDSLLAGSGAVALLSWGVLRIAVPLVTSAFESWFAAKFKLPTNDEK